MVWRFIPLAIFISIAGLFLASLFMGDPQKLPSVLEGKPVPAFDLPDLLNADARVRDDDLKTGNIILLNVWASWCGPCRDEHPFLMNLQEQGVNIVGLNYKDGEAAAKRFLVRLGNPYGKVGVDDNGRTAIDFGVYGVPETYIINGNGEIIFRHTGPLDENVIANEFMPRLKLVSNSSKLGETPQ